MLDKMIEELDSKKQEGYFVNGEGHVEWMDMTPYLQHNIYIYEAFQEGIFQ